MRTCPLRRMFQRPAHRDQRLHIASKRKWVVLVCTSRCLCRSIHARMWVQGLRVHDNPALHAACRAGTTLLPVFCLDPWFLKPNSVGINRLQFLLEALRDLDTRCGVALLQQDRREAANGLSP